LFILLSIADLAFTWHLLDQSGGKIYEANWLANKFRSRFGFAGLLVFKGFLVVLTVSLFGIIAASRPQVARRLAAFGCGAVGVVVLYSAVLCGSLEFPHTAYSGENRPGTRPGSPPMDPGWRRRMPFGELMAQARGALAAGCCTLQDAVDFLAAADKGKDPALLARRRSRIGASSDDEYLAAMVVRGALQLLEAEPSAEARGRGKALLTNYEASYGAALLPFMLEESRVFERRADEPRSPVKPPRPEGRL
jgi:hypothetical protein